VIEPLLTPLQQWLLFIGVSFVVGCVAWRVVVAPGAMRLLSGIHAPAVAEVERRVAMAGVATGFLLFGTWILRMVAQVMAFRDPFVPLSEDISFLLFETFWGTVWMAQGVIIPLLTLAFWGAARSRAAERSPGDGAPLQSRPAISGSWWGATVLAILLVATLALSSHAMGVESWKPLIVTSDAVHTLAAGSWIGALGLILTVGRPDSGSQGRLELFAAQIRSFSPLAIVSVTALVSMGIVLAWTHLTAVSDLWTVNYGRILSAKILVALGVLVVGFVNWRRGVPSMTTESGSGATWRRAAVEVSLALGVLLLTAFLVHSVKP
jgi:putative copper export protein